MDRRSRHRIGKCEELLSAAQKERDERLKQVLQVAPTYARRHAAAVAAIVLSGRPRIDEPLERAWARALQHYGIDVNTNQIAAARRLLPIINGDGDESARFTEIFRTTPVWLLQFTGMALDARLLRFDLPDVSDTLGWGSTGCEDAQRWPLLPAVSTAVRNWLKTSGLKLQRGHTSPSISWWQTSAERHAPSRPQPPKAGANGQPLRGMAFRQTWPLGSTPKRHTIGQFQTAGFR